MQTNDRQIADLMKAIDEGKAQLPDFQRGWMHHQTGWRPLFLFLKKRP